MNDVTSNVDLLMISKTKIGNSFTKGQFLIKAFYDPSEAAAQGCSVKNMFAKFTGKHLCQSLFFNKVAGLKPATLLKKRLCHRCFPVDFEEFL